MNELSFQPSVVSEPAGQATAGPARVQDEQPLIIRYLNIVKRWKWLLIGAVAVAITVGLVTTLLMTRQYSASSTLEIRRESDRIVNVEGVQPEAQGADMEFYDTQWGLLRSPSLAERVAVQLRLHEDPAFFELFGETDPAEELQMTSAARASASVREQRIREAGKILLENVTISPDRRSRLVQIMFTSPDPSLSMRVANAWGDAFIETSLERRFEATSYAREFLEERLEQLRQRLQDSERVLVAYAANQRIINIPTATTNGTSGMGSTERPIVAEDLSLLNRELNDATAARIAAQARLQKADGTSAEALTNQTIAELRARRATLAGEYAQLTSQFEPDYPPAEAMADQIAEIDRSISREEGRVRESLSDVYAAAATRESMLRARVNQLETQLIDLRGRTIQYNIYQREVDTNRELYDALLQRYKEIGIAGGVGVNNISVVDAAKVPQKPSSPNVLLNMALSLLVGLTVGVALALALEQLDDTISDPRELEGAIGLPLLGTIPTAEEENPVEELDDPKTPLVEAYLSVLTRLAFTTEHGVPRTLGVTSTRPGEGKSTTAYALARQLARTSGGVVLVDGDMRSPSVHQLCGIPNERGLSNYLAGDDDVASLLHPQPGRPTVMPAGPTPPNAAELLTGDRIAKLLRELEGRFEHIVIDTPPVMGLADTPLLGSLVEGIVFVVESRETRSSLAKIAVERLRGSKSRVIGGLLTKFQAQKAQYGYGYDYGYGYGGTRRDGTEAA